jgi:2-dehydropantoate 2-reductase
MKILVVGAGAVGQVYGLHLAAAGHELSFFVKEKYAAELAGGLTLHQLGRWRSRERKLTGYGVLSDVAEVAAQRWDQVWLTLPSDALRGELCTALLGVVGAATVIVLQPGISDGDHVRSLLPPAQVVQGMIPFISFHSPLPDGKGPEGMAFFLPPMAPTLIAGEAERAGQVIAALKAGGLAARAVEDFSRATAANTAFFQCMIAALECNRWQLHSLPGSPALHQGLAAAREATAVAAAETGASTLAMQPLLRPLVWRLLMPVITRIFPFNIEVYLKYHFSKVGGQTRDMLDSYVALGRRHGLSTEALGELREQLPSLG